ncbi:MAG: VIT domain-containing protein [Deltaproteobacteria bacterium]|nr:VIT domain-containing protein [Deltaproteobacteria bacterium]
MTAPLPLLSEDEVRSVTAGDDDRRSFGHLSCSEGLLPLKALHVAARVVGTFAHTTVKQTFVNSLAVPVEATYIFPLPDRAAATRFTMQVAGRTVEGDLQERGQARQTYDRAISQGKRASIAEEERPGTFTLRVGNLMPGEAATITLELTGPLPVADGEVTYRFPLVIAPRYIPGRPLSGEQVGDGTGHDTDAVPDASRISPPVLLGGYPNPVRLNIEVTLDPAGLPLSRVRSALHMAWADESQGLLRVQVGAGERLDRDFILRFCLGDAQLRTTVRATKLNDGRDDAFMLTVVPPTTTTATRPRDLVFVLDRSGSMGGWKMIAARRAVARMVDSLRAADRFSVLAFDDRVEAQSPKLQEGSDRNRFRACEWLAKVDARGGTEMAAPLSDAANLLQGGDLERDRVLVFVTDGQVGNEAQLMKLLGQRLKGTRLFALGIDQAVNVGFLNRLAALGGQGDAELVESEDRLDEVLTRCHRRIDAPVLAELSVDVEGATLVRDSVSPSRLPDVFVGVPAVVCGRIKRNGSGKPTLIVRGRLASGESFSQQVTVETTANSALLPAWGRLHLRDLEDRFDGGKGNKQELERRIVAVSLEAKVLCRFTAFVAVDHEVVNEGGRLHQVTQAVDQPAGWKGGQAIGSSGAIPPPPGGPPRPSPAMPPQAQSMNAPMAPPPPSPSSSSLSRSSLSVPMAQKSVASPPADFLDDAEEEFDAPRSAPAMAEAPMELSDPAPPARSSVLGGLFERAKDAFGGSGASSNESVSDKSSKREEAKEDRADRKAKAAPAKKRAAPEPESRPEPKPKPTTTTTTLAAFADRLRALIVRLDANEDKDAIMDDLRLLIEEAAHAGIPPAVRKPLQDALAALERGDVDAAKRTLEPHATPAPRGFWK